MGYIHNPTHCEVSLHHNLTFQLFKGIGIGPETLYMLGCIYLSTFTYFYFYFMCMNVLAASKHTTGAQSMSGAEESMTSLELELPLSKL